VADIEWTPDSEGSSGGSDASTLTLGSPRPDPANRFFEVVPDYLHIGPRKTALDRRLHVFTFREDYTVHVVIRHLAPSQWGLALELKRHLIAGGLVTLNTDDLDDASYENVQLAPGTTPEIKNDDDDRQHFSFTVDLAGDDPILVNYDG
jgi:hypothetical protein